jgi:hypothetical protein
MLSPQALHQRTARVARYEKQIRDAVTAIKGCCKLCSAHVLVCAKRKVWLHSLRRHIKRNQTQPTHY